MGIHFSLYNIGQSALRTSQLGLATTGHNIANVNTPGFSRQEVQQSASPGIGTQPLLAGNGVTIDGVRSMRDSFIETRLVTETGVSGRLTAQRDALLPVEAAFNETSGGGISAAISNFFGAFRDLEAHPTSLPLRTSVVQAGHQLGAAFGRTASRLGDIRTQANSLLVSTVDQVNTLSDKIAGLNAKIQVAQSTGGATSELVDSRNQATNELAELVGVKSSSNQDGTLTLTLADGHPLVIGNQAARLVATPTPPAGLASLTVGGKPAVINNGQIKGLQDAIGLIGTQLSDLDSLAASIADRVNTLHTAGEDLTGTPGVPFFVASTGVAPPTASTLSVSGVLQANPNRVAAAAAGAGSGDATISRQIANLLTDKTSTVGTKTGDFHSIYSSLVTDAGEHVKSASDALATQQLILTQTSEQRNAFSGVSLDEEAVNLLRYQRSFEAAARFLKVADETTQMIIALGQS